MSCPPQSSPTPTLRQILEQLAAVDPGAAAVYRPGVELLEDRIAEARAQLQVQESALAEVKADGAIRSYTAWEVHFSKVQSLRFELRGLGVDEGSRRGVLERALFLARQGLAIGRVVCRACGGSGDGEPLDGGACLVPTSCDPCAGTGYVSV